MRNGYKVYDTDTHIRPSADTLEKYLSPRVRELLPDLESCKVHPRPSREESDTPPPKTFRLRSGAGGWGADAPRMLGEAEPRAQALGVSGRFMHMATGTVRMKRGLALIAGLAAVMPAFAQTSKPVRLIVGVPPGGTSDTSARIIAPKLAELLGQQILVENRPGANNGIATEYVARSAPDGQTVLWAFSGGIVVNPVFYPDVRYDPLKDLVPVDLIGTFQFILVVPRSVPANSIKELLALAKASGANEYTYASGGIGSPNHLAGEMLKRAAGVNLRHVPYKGGGPAVVSVLSGETKMYFAGIGSVREHMKSGALKALAVTGPKRASEAPSVPTMQEAGIAGYDVQAWIGALVPAGTSEEVVARLHGGLSRVVAMPEIDVRLRREGLEPAAISPQEFGARIKRELAMWDRLIKEAGIKPE